MMYESVFAELSPIQWKITSSKPFILEDISLDKSRLILIILTILIERANIYLMLTRSQALF